MGSAGAGRHWIGVERGHQLVELLGRASLAVEGASGIGRALVKKGLKRRLKPGELLHRRLERVSIGIGSTVEDSGAHRRREQRRPSGAELAAVREPEIRGAVLTERLAQQVYIPGRVVRADVQGNRVVLLDAAVGELLRLGD